MMPFKEFPRLLTFAQLGSLSSIFRGRISFNRVIKRLIGSVIFYLSLLVPRNNNIWVFGAWNGNKWADNSKYMFLYVSEHHPDVNIVWLSKNKGLIKYLKGKSLKAVHPYSLKGFYYTLFAKVGFITHSLFDLNAYCTGRMKIVNFWHGIPLKPVLYSDPKRGTRARVSFKKLLSILFPYYWKDLNYAKMLLVTSSDFTRKIFERVFGTGDIKITGYPRIDPLKAGSERPIKNGDIIKGIYLPTYRRENESNIFDSLKNQIDNLDAYLRRSNIILDIKVHSYEVHEFLLSEKPSNISIIDDTQPDNEVYQILKNYSFLISDYSSVIFDYMILRRPIILAPFDLDEYVLSNGDFLISYDWLPYPKAKSWSDVMSAIDELKKTGFKISDEQMNFIGYFHLYDDNKNSERVFEEVVKFIRL